MENLVLLEEKKKICIFVCCFPVRICKYPYCMEDNNNNNNKKQQ